MERKSVQYMHLSNYGQTSNASRTKSHDLNVSRLVLQFDLPNPLKPGVESRMIWMINNFWPTKVPFIFEVWRYSLSDRSVLYLSIFPQTWPMHKSIESICSAIRVEFASVSGGLLGRKASSTTMDYMGAIRKGVYSAKSNTEIFVELKLSHVRDFDLVWWSLLM